MTKKEILDNVRIVADVVSDELSLAVIKKPFADGLVVTQESRPLRHEEIIAYIFKMAKYLIAKDGNNCTISTKNETLTLTIKEN